MGDIGKNINIREEICRLYQEEKVTIIIYLELSKLLNERVEIMTT